jgi:flavin reductase (DIM6/NTAB) family NADH-FMN oxidoreductase RutF
MSTFTQTELVKDEQGATVPRSPGVHADRLRGVMGHFATGVTIITTRDRSGRPFGTTANAVSSVSLRPPLVLACLRRESETLAGLLEHRRFAVNVLHSSQAELSDRFARRAADDTWDAVAHRSANGIPLLEGAIATVQCELHDVADGGDHVVVIGHVIALDEASADADPLLFYRGSYRRIGAAAPEQSGDRRDPPPLSGVLNALARAVRTLDLRAVRLICAPADGLRAARLGSPPGELIDPHSLVPAS